MTDDQFNDLVNTVQQLTEKTDSLADSIATVDTKVEKVKYLSRLFDVNVTYPAENDVLVYDKTGKWKNIQYDEVGFEPGEGGESDIYLIGTDDPTSPTNENTYSAARINEDRLNKISESGDSMNGNLTMVEGTKIIVNGIQSHNAQQSTDSGSGLIYNVDSSGNSYVEVDSLCVRKSALFNQLEIKKITSVGGSLIVSPASNTIIRVETVSALYEGQYQNVYRCYYRNSDDQSKESIVTDFQAGDLAKIQSFNISDTGIYEEPVQNRFYWGKVLGIGSNSIGGYIDLSQTDVDSSTNTQPKAGDSLVMYGNKTNISRQNVIDITTYANNAPAIILYQGIDDYSTTDKAIIEMAYDSAKDQSQAYMNVYGRMYVGTKDKTTSYMKFDPTENGGTGQLTVKAKIVVEGQDGDETLIEGGYIKTDLINVNNLLADAIWTGEIKVGGTAEDPNFYVDSNGNITAKHATLTGGTISGNVSIQGDVSFSGSLNGPTGILGGFSVGGNLTAGDYTISYTSSDMLLSASLIRFRGNDVYFTKSVSIGAVQSYFPDNEIAGDLLNPITIISKAKRNNVPNVGMYIDCNGALKYSGSTTGGNFEDAGDIAMYIKSGYIKGLRLFTRWVRATANMQHIQAEDMDTIIMVGAESGDYDAVYVDLPPNPKEGHTLFIFKNGSYRVLRVQDTARNNLYAQGRTVEYVEVNYGGFIMVTYTETQRLDGKGLWFAVN